MDLVLVFPLDVISSYSVACYVSHRHASEDAVSEMGVFLELLELGFCSRRRCWFEWHIPYILLSTMGIL